jgi:hypothetical protein
MTHLVISAPALVPPTLWDSLRIEVCLGTPHRQSIKFIKSVIALSDQMAKTSA